VRLPRARSGQFSEPETTVIVAFEVHPKEIAEGAF
jgi:hypothetical protein